MALIGHQNWLMSNYLVNSRSVLIGYSKTTSVFLFSIKLQLVQKKKTIKFPIFIVSCFWSKSYRATVAFLSISTHKRVTALSLLVKRMCTLGSMRAPFNNPVKEPSSVKQSAHNQNQRWSSEIHRGNQEHMCCTSSAQMSVMVLSCPGHPVALT